MGKMKGYFYAALVAFVLSFIFCKLLIPLLRKMKAGQNILSYVKEHQKKGGTPTMGGLAFVTAAVISAAIFIKKADRTALLVLLIGVSYMIIGLLDDFLKKRHKQNLGLRAWQKMLFQALVALFCGIYAVRAELTSLHIPFTNKSIEIGVWAFPLTFFLFLATVNAVNLTDGLDGLAAGSCVPYFLCIGLLILLQGGNKNISTVSFCLVGALFAYLFFNVSPASVFMGDTGSLALGGFAASIVAFTGNGLYLAVIGITFVLSVISVILQVIYYKVTKGKRIFLMSPIHHHFQQKGYSESKIAYAYSAITFLLGVLCIVTRI